MFKIRNMNVWMKQLLLFELYKIVIEMAYMLGVHAKYEYMHFGLDINIGKFWISNVIYLIFLVLLPRRNEKISGILKFFLTISVTPFISLYWLTNQPSLFAIYTAGMFIVLELILNIELPQYHFIELSSATCRAVLEGVFWIYVISVVYFCIKRGGVDIRAFSFDTIYALRSEKVSFGILGNYMVSWCAKVFFPIFLAYYAYCRKYVKAIVCVILQLLMYLCFGFKAYLIIIGLVLGMIVIGRYFKDTFKVLLTSLTCLAIPSCLVPLLYESKLIYLLNGTYTMRMLFEPAKIKFYYFEYFSSNFKLHFSEGLIGKLFILNYPYDEPIGFVITRYIAGENEISNSNTGIIADAFSNAGFGGMICVAVMLAIVLIAIGALSTDIPSYLLFAMLGYLCVCLNDNAFLTNLLTNGWLVFIVMIVFVNGALGKGRKK